MTVGSITKNILQYIPLSKKYKSNNHILLETKTFNNFCNIGSSLTCFHIQVHEKVKKLMAKFKKLLSNTSFHINLRIEKYCSRKFKAIIWQKKEGFV